MKSARQKLAAWGESLAADFLIKGGYDIIARNVRTAYGEIDIIARKLTNEQSYPSSTSLILFVEVKTRTSTAFGYPEQSVNAKKRLHLLASAQEYIRLHPEIDGEWRVDVIAILRRPGEAPAQIKVFENAVTAN